MPRSESTLSGATGVRVGATPRTWVFALGLAVVCGAAIAVAALRLGDATAGSGVELPGDAAIVEGTPPPPGEARAQEPQP